ncbi:MAG: Lrp/AsnC family transcriptional regulator [Proteobacteria bacterium]|nr:MAG: Lrp/AsnC family transcriptional regulator [Pseudomonadota bacterium]
MDKYDRKILKVLQSEGRISNKDLAQEVALSQAPCWRRVDALQKSGLIKGYTAIVDQEKVGLNITAFAQITLDNHHPETVQHFDRSIQQWPEILECHATSGEYDYLLKIVTRDMNSYNHLIYEKILTLPSIRSVNTSFSMQQKKRTSHLPISDDDIS